MILFCKNILFFKIIFDLFPKMEKEYSRKSFYVTFQDYEMVLYV